MKTEFGGVDHIYNADSFNEMDPKSRYFSYNFGDLSDRVGVN